MPALALAVGILVALMSVFFQLHDRRVRAREFRKLVLNPNCLLTREPLVFLEGKKSVFRLFDHWNDIPLYLREHGYEVYVIEPRGGGVEARGASVAAALAVLKPGTRSLFHLIADGSLERELKLLADVQLARVSTYTAVKSVGRAWSRAPLSPQDPRSSSSLIEVFELDSAVAATGFHAHLKLALLKAHNIWIHGRAGPVYAAETAEISKGFKAERRFLDLAISLAERDAIGSD